MIVCRFDAARRCAQVLSDVIHISDSKLTYYPGTFRDFQRLRPEIAAGLPSPAGAVQRAKAQLAVSASSNSLNGGDGETKARVGDAKWRALARLTLATTGRAAAQ